MCAHEARRQPVVGVLCAGGGAISQLSEGEGPAPSTNATNAL